MEGRCAEGFWEGHPGLREQVCAGAGRLGRDLCLTQIAETGSGCGCSSQGQCEDGADRGARVGFTEDAVWRIHRIRTGAVEERISTEGGRHLPTLFDRR